MFCRNGSTWDGPRATISAGGYKNVTDNLAGAMRPHAPRRIHAKDGAIDEDDARTLRFLLLRCSCRREWTVCLDGCYPASDAAAGMLREGLSGASRIWLRNLDTRDVKQRRMLDCVFATSSTKAPIATTELRMRECHLEPDIYPAVTSWASAARVERFGFVSTNFDPCEFLAEVYKSNPTKPKSIALGPQSLEEHDLGKLRDWEELENLKVHGIAQGLESNLRGLSDLKHVRTLQISRQSPPYSPLVVDDISKLLRLDDCKLEELIVHAPETCTDFVQLFEALKSNSSLSKLEIVDSTLSDRKIEMLANCLRDNSVLTQVIWVAQEGAISLNVTEALVAVLQAKNSTLESIRILTRNFHPGSINEYLRPFTNRNLAGRGLLSANQNCVPAGLWPFVLSRISKLALDDRSAEIDAANYLVRQICWQA